MPFCLLPILKCVYDCVRVNVCHFHFHFSSLRFFSCSSSIPLFREKCMKIHLRSGVASRVPCRIIRLSLLPHRHGPRVRASHEPWRWSRVRQVRAPAFFSFLGLTPVCCDSLDFNALLLSSRHCAERLQVSAERHSH